MRSMQRWRLGRRNTEHGSRWCSWAHGTLRLPTAARALGRDSSVGQIRGRLRLGSRPCWGLGARSMSALQPLEREAGCLRFVSLAHGTAARIALPPQPSPDDPRDAGAFRHVGGSSRAGHAGHVGVAASHPRGEPSSRRATPHRRRCRAFHPRRRRGSRRRAARGLRTARSRWRRRHRRSSRTFVSTNATGSGGGQSLRLPRRRRGHGPPRPAARPFPAAGLEQHAPAAPKDHRLAPGLALPRHTHTHTHTPWSCFPRGCHGTPRHAGTPILRCV